MKVRLFRDHYRHIDGVVVKHRVGEIIDVPKEEAEQINQAEMQRRKARRLYAARFLTTPEGRKK